MMRYLKGTIDFGIDNDRDDDSRLYGYMDSDWVASATDRKSTSGGCYYLVFSMISWIRKKQSSVSLITAEAEYIAACFASCEAIWL